ncbi:MAG TPA: hypothetical protein ENL08_06485, partial [Bacteroidetes bacterium]|nr:hypothetical protein [Bacteroidota bacterium]
MNPYDRNRVLATIFTAALVILLTTFKPALSMELRSYHITCNPDEFEYINSHPDENIYIDCTFEFNGDEWNDARFRIRGESSRQYPKKSYKVNFDAHNRFRNRDKLNLISEYTDASFAREFLSYDFYHRAGLLASRTWFARLYVNGTYMGLYLDVEQIDECFLGAAGLPRDATIYKADVDGCLLRTSDRIDEVWQKKTNLETGWYDLLELIEWLDTVPLEWFFDELDGYFDREELARIIAVNGVIGNTSTYYHNYYLIHDHGQDGLWRMLPWDIDRTFRYYYSFTSPGFYRCYRWNLGTNILISNCWRNREMRELIYDQMQGLVDSLFREDYYRAMSDTLSELLYQAVRDDSLKAFTLDRFTVEIDSFPIFADRRGAAIIDMMTEYAAPFDLERAIITPAGVFFSWDSTFVPDGSPFSYNVIVSTEPTLPVNNRIEIGNLHNTYLLYDELGAGTYYWKVRALTNRASKTSCLNYNSAFPVPENGFNATVVDGQINESTTLTAAQSPYSLPDGLTVAA